MKRYQSTKKKIDWLWILWELGLLDDAWPPEEVVLENGN